jgi:hypothetical protein
VQHVIAELHGRYNYPAFQDAMLRHGLQARKPDAYCTAITAHR